MKRIPMAMLSAALVAVLISGAPSSTVMSAPAKVSDLPDPKNAWGVSVIRIGRPTDKLDENKRFYVEGLGMPVIQGFEGHDGFSGVIIGAGEMLGLHPEALHLEFTKEDKGSPGTAPSDDNNLVLYIPDWKKIEQTADRLVKLGYKPREKSQNPWWQNYCGLDFVDPDGWHVILFPKKSDLDPAEYNNYLKGDVCPDTYKKYFSAQAKAQ